MSGRRESVKPETVRRQRARRCVGTSRHDGASGQAGTRVSVHDGASGQAGDLAMFLGEAEPDTCKNHELCSRKSVARVCIRCTKRTTAAASFPQRMHDEQSATRDEQSATREGAHSEVRDEQSATRNGARNNKYWRRETSRARRGTTSRRRGMVRATRNNKNRAVANAGGRNAEQQGHPAVSSSSSRRRGRSRNGARRGTTRTVSHDDVLATTVHDDAVQRFASGGFDRPR